MAAAKGIHDLIPHTSRRQVCRDRQTHTHTEIHVRHRHIWCLKRRYLHIVVSRVRPHVAVFPKIVLQLLYKCMWITSWLSGCVSWKCSLCISTHVPRPDQETRVTNTCVYLPTILTMSSLLTVFRDGLPSLEVMTTWSLTSLPVNWNSKKLKITRHYSVWWSLPCQWRCRGKQVPLYLPISLNYLRRL